MDLTYLYYQCRFHYYKFIVFKWKLTTVWDKLNSGSKWFLCWSFCFGSVLTGWLLLELVEKRRLELKGVIEEVDDLDDEKIRCRRRQKGVPPGLYNEGNTCFSNCIMQSLASCPSFYKWTCDVLKSYEYSNITLFPSIQKLLRVLTNVTGNENNYSTGDVMRSIQSHGWVISHEQQDAYEFFQVLVSTMEEELTKISKGSTDSIFDIKGNYTTSSSIYNKVSKNLPVLMSNELMSPFKGSSASKLKCLSCGQQLPVKFEMFDSLMLSLANVSPVNATLSGCLDEWIKPELLHEVECEKCLMKYGKKYSTFSKQVSLAKLPTCLCIQLQRTSFTPFGAARKNQLYVQFPEYLDVHSYTYGHTLSKETQSIYRKSHEGLSGGSKEYLELEGSSSQTLYRLNSVIVHFGGANSGHFVTYRRVVNNITRWFHISDSFVKEIPQGHVFKSTAYLLFYERVS